MGRGLADRFEVDSLPSVLRTIVVGVDFSKATPMAMRAVDEIAAAYDAKRVHLVHVLPIPDGIVPLPKEVIESARARARDRLEGLQLSNARRVTREIRSGVPAQQLVAAGDQVGADVIVVSGRGHGVLAEMFLGSVASSLIRVARCPVLVVHGPLNAQFETIVAAVDLSLVSRNVLDSAFRLGAAQTSGKGASRVQVLSLYEHPFLSSSRDALLPRALSPEEIEALGEEHRKHVMELVARVPSHGVDVDVEVMSKAPAANVIVDVASMVDAKLIVLGTSGQGAWHRMILGSTSNYVLNRAPCPVLVVPHELRERTTQDLPSPMPV